MIRHFIDHLTEKAGRASNRFLTLKCSPLTESSRGDERLFNFALQPVIRSEVNWRLLTHCGNRKDQEKINRMTRSVLTKENLARYALEAILIVFSVLLALFLDSALEDRREARIVDELTSHIADEMTRNLAIVDEWLPYHRNVITEIDRYLASEELQQGLLTSDGIDYGRLMKKGLIQDFYSNSSWKLAQQSEISSRIEFDVSYAISQAYLSQQNVNTTLQRFADFVFERQTHDPEQLTTSLHIFRNLFQELAGQQGVLQHNYREALKAVDRMNADPS